MKKRQRKKQFKKFLKEAIPVFRDKIIAINSEMILLGEASINVSECVKDFTAVYNNQHRQGGIR
jgi:hypothetical protein